MARSLSIQEKERIAQAIARVERTTSGQIVVAVVDRCSAVSGTRSAAAWLSTMGLTLIAHRLFPFLGAQRLLLLELPLALLCWMAWGWGPLARHLLVPHAIEDAVMAKAHELFLKRGIHQTRERNGVLILISEFERHVAILGDAGIHQRIGDEGWTQHVNAITQGIGTKKGTEAIEQVVAQIGDVLAQFFPPHEGGRNELPDRVLEEG